MPYKKLTDLPTKIKKHLPKHAQEIFKEAYNNAEKQYDDPKKRRVGSSKDETTNKVAWSAVKKEYEKGSDGNWHKK